MAFGTHNKVTNFHICFLNFGLQSSFISILPHSSTHSRMRSKRLRTTEEPIALDGSTALTSSKRKGLGSPTGPKVRKSAAGTSCKEEEEKEKKMEAESKHKQNQNPFQLSGKRHQVYCMRGCDLNSLTACLCCRLPCGTLYKCFLILNRSLQTDVCGQGKSCRE